MTATSQCGAILPVFLSVFETDQHDNRCPFARRNGRAAQEAQCVIFVRE
jgi:hypothetical protein